MREKNLSYFRLVVAFLMVCSMLITSMPLDVNAEQNTSGDQNEQIYVLDGYTVSFKIDTVWNSGYNISVVIQNTGSETISDWYMYLKYDTEITNMWNASVYERISPYMVITNAVWNKDVYPNGTAGFGYTGSGEFPGFPEVITVTSGYDPAAMDSGNGDHGDDGGETTDEDSDGDGLSDAFEEAIGSNPELIDTDEDGLSDYQEVYLTLTDPTMIDSDGNGVLDPNEDLDEDGLCNLEELTGGTDPSNTDTDRDDLNDYDEIYLYGCDPLNTDSDGDGLSDGDDVLLGFSPTMPDTDMNGILDSEEKIYQTTENDFAYEDAHGLASVAVSLNVSGNIDKEIEITNVYEFDSQSREVVGLIGAPIDISCDVPFDNATITFSYDESALGDTSEENLSLMWYDEENHWYQILDQDSVVDTQNNKVSYTTTHFSTYLLVDVSKWVNTWMEDIDYGDDALITQPPRELDLVYVIDDSQYYSYIDFHTSFIQARNKYNYGNGVNFSGLVDFKEGFSAWYSGDTRYPYKFVFSEDDWRGNPYFGETMDSVLRSIMYCFDHNPELYGNDDKAIVIVSDGNFEIGDDAINECIERGIKIYTIDFEHGAHYWRFKRMSTLTGGQYYFGNILDTPDFLLDCIVYDSHELLNGKDKDGDGLLDVYETEGMRTLTGRLITTDPDKVDTDDDLLSDYDETGPVYDLNLYIGQGIVKTVRFIVPYSDPNMEDTDGDGYNDNEDSHPLRREYIEVNIQNKYAFEYLNIGNKYFCGRQDLWYDKSPYPRTENLNLLYFANSHDYRIGKCGCGLMAATDLELFFIQQNDYSVMTDSVVINTNSESGNIDLAEYMNYVEYNEKMKYTISPSVQGVTVSVSPYDICMWISMLLTANNHQYSNVRWAPYSKYDDTLDSVKTMISRNIPVVFSFDNHFNDLPQLKMYFRDRGNGIDDISRAIHQEYNKRIYFDEDCGSHYMTIIGYVEYIDENNTPKYLLKVASWGFVYYVRYEEFADELNIFNNILEIY